MNNVNKTLYIPLYGKAYVSRRGLLLEDKKAEEINARVVSFYEKLGLYNGEEK